MKGKFTSNKRVKNVKCTVIKKHNYTVKKGGRGELRKEEIWNM